MGTNYFVVGYDHPAAEEQQDTDPADAWEQIQALIIEAWAVGLADGQRVAADYEQKIGMSDDHPIFVRGKAIAFPPKRLHIGKSSLGWCFGLATHEGIQSLADWERVWATPGVRIEDEYGQLLSVEEMRDRITKRSWKPRELSAEERAVWLRQNYAIEGPNGLVRHTYQARIPEEGPSATYDLCEGRFR